MLPPRKTSCSTNQTWLYAAWTCAKYHSAMDQRALYKHPELRSELRDWRNALTVHEAHQKAILDKTPLARTGNPADIAGAIAYLVCDAPFVTGQILSVDGGRSLNM